MEKPMDVVRRFCAAWSDDASTAELAAFFTDDAVYHNIPMAPVIGRENIAKNIASFIRPGAPGIMGIKFRLIHIAANGPVVMTERVDAFRLPNKSFELPVMRRGRKLPSGSPGRAISSLRFSRGGRFENGRVPDLGALAEQPFEL